LRKKDGISGFPKRSESIYDAFGTGHSSTSLSAIAGMAKAAELLGKNNFHIAVIGDGAMTAGMTFEALQQMTTIHANILIILNDNGMSIDANTGSLHKHFQDLQSGFSPSIFEILGLKYEGIVDGHQLEKLIFHFDNFKKVGGRKRL
jgi:1-deoxy-D-xylulose-5-phosphate synthase